jgi:hypothetical protein
MGIGAIMDAVQTGAAPTAVARSKQANAPISSNSNKGERAVSTFTTKDGLKIERMRYAGNNLEKARDVFANAASSRVVPLSVMYISAGRR